MQQNVGITAHEQSLLDSLREKLATYHEQLLRDIRSGATANTGRFWTVEDLQRMVDGLPVADISD